MKYSWQWIESNVDFSTGETARTHTLESGHNQFSLTYGPTLSCAHPDCEPQWAYSAKEEDE